MRRIEKVIGVAAGAALAACAMSPTTAYATPRASLASHLPSVSVASARECNQEPIWAFLDAPTLSKLLSEEASLEDLGYEVEYQEHEDDEWIAEMEGYAMWGADGGATHNVQAVSPANCVE